MKSKKGKALAMKLIDDLLGDDGEDNQEGKESQNSKQNMDATRVASLGESASEESDDALELSQSVYAEGSNPFGAGEDSGPGLTSVQDSDDNDSDEINDATIKLNESKIIPAPSDKRAKPAVADTTRVIGSKRVPEPPPEPAFTTMTSSNIKASVGRYVGSGGMSSPAQTTLVQSENLRVAQQKILELEEEISRLRTDNEDLAAAGETLRKVADESKASQEALERRLESVQDLAHQEQQLMRESMDTKDRKISELQNKIEEMELRLSTNIQKIRVRERELENRLELVRMEGEALARSKDEMVLDLKRQVDQLNMELENYRSKGQELNSQLKDKQELLRRTVKALRLALSMLEGDDEINLLKKVK